MSQGESFGYNFTFFRTKLWLFFSWIFQLHKSSLLLVYSIFTRLISLFFVLFKFPLEYFHRSTTLFDTSNAKNCTKYLKILIFCRRLSEANQTKWNVCDCVILFLFWWYENNCFTTSVLRTRTRLKIERTKKSNHTRTLQRYRRSKRNHFSFRPSERDLCVWFDTNLYQ